MNHLQKQTDYEKPQPWLQKQFNADITGERPLVSTNCRDDCSNVSESLGSNTLSKNLLIIVVAVIPQ